jgi:hypothetical protein
VHYKHLQIITHQRQYRRQAECGGKGASLGEAFLTLGKKASSKKSAPSTSWRIYHHQLLEMLQAALDGRNAVRLF